MCKKANIFSVSLLSFTVLDVSCRFSWMLLVWKMEMCIFSHLCLCALAPASSSAYNAWKAVEPTGPIPGGLRKSIHLTKIGMFFGKGNERETKTKGNYVFRVLGSSSIIKLRVGGFFFPLVPSSNDVRVWRLYWVVKVNVFPGKKLFASQLSLSSETS